MRESKLAVLAFAALLFAVPAWGQGDHTGRSSASETGAPQSAGWWHALGDATLSSLIAQGLDANLDLAQARARIGRSRALLAGAEAAFGPGGSAGLQGRASQVSEAEAPGLHGAQRRGHSTAAALEFSWEIDLFGRLGHQAGAAAQRLQASAAQLRGARLAVSAEIADAYFGLVGTREQLVLAHTVAESRQRTLRLVAGRAAGGIAAPIDDLRARAELEAALAEIPQLEEAERVATHRIAVLTGRSPAGFTVPAGVPAPTAVVPIRLPEGADWLARRPDVQEQEAQLRARALDVKAVHAEFLPRLTLGGVLGFVAGSVTGLGAGGTLSWLGAPSLLAPLFDRPKIEARLAVAQAGEKQALAAYRQRLLLAAEEVENALARHGASQRQLQALQRRTGLALEAERLARVRYEAGAADLLELLEAQRTASQAQGALSQALVRQRQHLVAVFRGMGADA